MQKYDYPPLKKRKVEKNKQEKPIEELFGLKRITTQTEVYPSEYACKFDGTFAIPLGDFVSVSGLPKCCKSTFLSIISASLIGTTKRFGIERNIPIDQLHYFDTEQKEYDTKRWLDKTILIGADETKLCVFNLRDKDTIARRDAICKYCYTLERGNHIIMIDGWADLLLSNNDERESTEIRDMYLKLLKDRPNISIIIVQHLNPSSGKDGKMRGHSGSDIQRKEAEGWVGEVIYEIPGDSLSKIEYYQFFMKQSRGKARAANPIRFKFDGNGIVVPCSPIVREITSSTADRWNKIKGKFVEGTPYKTKYIKDIIKHVFGINDEYAKDILDGFKGVYLDNPTRGTYYIKPIKKENNGGTDGGTDGVLF